MTDANTSAEIRSEEISGADALMQALIAEGVDTIFGYPGGAIMPVYDALVGVEDRVNHILVRHEQGASHAAEGYARMQGKPGVCFATSGPGATNLVTGIADAMLDSIPMVCITGQVFSPLLGTDAFQETDVIGVTIPITKWNYQVTRAEEIPEIIAKAFYIAKSGRPGPVLVDITKDAQVNKIPVPEYKPYEPTYDLHVTRYKDLSGVEKAAELINNAKRPFLFVGHGIRLAKAEKEILEFVEKSGIPVASTLHGLSTIPTAHDLYVGMLGMHGNYAPNILTNEADVIIAIGMRFDDRVTGRVDKYAPNAKIVHVEVDPAEIHKVKRAEVALIADAKEALTELLPHIKERSHDEWLAHFHEKRQMEIDQVIHRDTRPEKDGILMSEAIYQLSEVTAGEAVVVADVGQHQMMAARYYEFSRPNSFLTSGGLGTMGYALPAGIGAKFGAPDREVIVVCGDGGFQMTFQELGTIMQENLKVKTIVLNNSFLGMVRQWQQLFFDKRYSGVNMQNPDFVAICEGFGIKSKRVSCRTELRAALEEMHAFDGAYFLEVVVEKETNVFPMIPAGAAVNEVRLS